MHTHNSANEQIQTLLTAAGLTVNDDDLDAVVRLYQRFADARDALSRAHLGETEPLTIVELRSERSDAHERS